MPALGSPAAGVRTHLDLLLGEHVMILAKETAAAVDHDDDYAGYTALLTSNASELADLIRSAFGDTAADNFRKSWTAQNASLVDYGIGVVTHNDNKASSAMSMLTGQLVPDLAGRITDMSGLASASVTQFLTEQLNYDKAFIDDAGAQNYSSFYADLQTAYFAGNRLGDALAARIAVKFPDRFPGDPTVPAVDRQVSVNVLLQEHAFLVTMTTDAVAGARDADRAAAAVALNTNAGALSRSLSVTGFDAAWSARITALIAYAQQGDATTRQAVIATGSKVASSVGIGSGSVADELNALIKVIDDQRAKASDRIPGDDRTAATSMQPVADAIVLGPTI